MKQIYLNLSLIGVNSTLNLLSFDVNSGKNNDRGANKSLIIHKTSQNNRNNII
jgi:hypothetical protein